METMEELKKEGVNIFSMEGIKRLFQGARAKMEPRLKSNPILNPPKTDETKQLTDGTN